MLNRKIAPEIKDAVEFNLQLKQSEQFTLDNENGGDVSLGTNERVSKRARRTTEEQKRRDEAMKHKKMSSMEANGSNDNKNGVTYHVGSLSGNGVTPNRSIDLMNVDFGHLAGLNSKKDMNY